MTPERTHRLLLDESLCSNLVLTLSWLVCSCTLKAGLSQVISFYSNLCFLTSGFEVEQSQRFLTLRQTFLLSKIFTQLI